MTTRSYGGIEDMVAGGGQEVSMGRVASSAGLGKGLGTTIGTMITPGVGTIVGGLIDIGFGVWDYYSRKKEMERLEAKADARQRYLDKKEGERYKDKLDFSLREMRNAERERRKTWAWKKDEQNWDRSHQLRSIFMNNMANNVELENRLMSIFPRR